ncbi:hypothetical protein [Myxococcus stipitatus]|uniref:hypothetical protein n=1 Tax=Myxococcus stipitatus TaxID=83455 RepID=UPI0030CCBFC4
METTFKTRVARDISRTAFLRDLKRRGTLSADFDVELDAEELVSEAPALRMVRRERREPLNPEVPGVGSLRP